MGHGGTGGFGQPGLQRKTRLSQNNKKIKTQFSWEHLFYFMQ
jgi:hypothetical protein